MKQYTLIEAINYIEQVLNKKVVMIEYVDEEKYKFHYKLENDEYKHFLHIPINQTIIK
jgi:hypothetical protein